MKERPIIFKARDVRAILSGTKTQTRRVVKPQPSPGLLADYAEIRATRGSTRTDAQMLSDCLPCPYGQPGDRLWVRETFQRFTDDGEILYRADPAGFEAMNELKRDECLEARWRPAIHMPRWASRITLEVTGVRVDRLRDISRGDAIAEGCPFANMAAGPDPRQWFADVWREIYGTGSWDDNPWAWAITFKRLEAKL